MQNDRLINFFFFKVFLQAAFHCQKISNVPNQVTRLWIVVLALYQRPFYVPCTPDSPKKLPSTTLVQLRNSPPCRCFTISPNWGCNPQALCLPPPSSAFPPRPSPNPIAATSPGSPCPYLGAEAFQSPRRAGPREDRLPSSVAEE